MIVHELGAASAAKAAARVRRAEKPLAVEGNSLDGRRMATVVVTLPAHANTSIPSVAGRKVADTAQAELTEHGAQLPLLMPNLDRSHVRRAAERELVPHTQPERCVDSS